MFVDEHSQVFHKIYRAIYRINHIIIKRINCVTSHWIAMGHLHHGVILLLGTESLSFCFLKFKFGNPSGV